MEFRLHYRGPLKSNGGTKDKHQIRRRFHEQLKVLWQQKPLKDSYLNLILEKGPDLENFARNVGNFTFVPLVNEKVNLIADLDIVLLRPEEPGAIVTQCGDIDNRLKTLLDALRMPKQDELKNFQPESLEIPHFFCLLEDDNLITRLAIETDRLLEPVGDKSEVEMLIRVHTKVTIATLDNIGLGV